MNQAEEPSADLDSQLALQLSRERYLYTVTLSPMIAWTADQIGGVLEVDGRGLEQFGLTASQARGQGFFSIVHPDDRPNVARMWRDNASLGHPIDQDIRMRLSDGNFRWFRSRAAPRRDAEGRILRWYGTIEDVHDRKIAIDALQWTAEHDGLTGLWNRAAFQRGFSNAIAVSRTEGCSVGLLLLDIDNFKLVNDELGHVAGDALLQLIAARLDGIGTRPVMAGRLGGDEFALFISEPTEAGLRQQLALITDELARPLRDNSFDYQTWVSVGIAIFPAHGVDAAALRSNADLALYEAKGRGGGVCYFNSSMRARMQSRLSSLSVARDIVRADRIVAYYQPKVDLGSGSVRGFEALLRWRHLGRDVQSPGLIAPAFEEMGLAVAIGQRMRACVADDVRGWVQQRVRFDRIAVNVSAAEFRIRGFATQWLNDLAVASIPPSCFEIEVTESVFLSRDVSEVRKIIDELKEAGVTIALDDFGTGYASLAHLKQFPVDVLKIDRSFVRRLSDRRNKAIVNAIVGLGRDLGITTVAEGVETVIQAERLRANGCDLAQGFLFSPGVPADEVPGLAAKAWTMETMNDRRRGRERRARPAHT